MMAYVSTIDEEEADDESRAFYEGITEYTGGRIPPSSTVHAGRSDFEQFYTGATRITKGETLLSRNLKEKVAVVVSATNQSSSCLSSHTENLESMGFPEDEIESLVEGYYFEEFDERTDAALEFAETMTERSEEITQEDHERLRETGFSDDEIKELMVLTGYYNYINRVVNASGL